MSKTRIVKIIAASLGLLLLVTLIVFVYIFSSLSSALSGPPPNEYVIHFGEIGESVYVRARSWGLTGDHQEIIVANSPIVSFESDDERHIVYLDSRELYYKKAGSDTLEIHVAFLVEVPEGFSSRVKIKQFKLDFDEARRYADHYEEYGLSKISVYSNN